MAPCKKIIEFERRAKRARLVRSNLSQCGYEVKTRSRSSNAANIWARGSRPPLVEINRLDRSNHPTGLRPHDYDNEKGKNHFMVLQKASKQDKAKKMTKLLRNKFIRKSKKVRQKSSKGWSCHVQKQKMNAASGKCKLYRDVHVKLERISTKTGLLRKGLSIVKRVRGHASSKSSNGNGKHRNKNQQQFQMRRKYKRSTEKMRHGANETVRRKVGRPPLNKSPKVKATGQRHGQKTKRKYTFKNFISRTRPKESLMQLIVGALAEKPEEKRVPEIYRCITLQHPYYRSEDRGWKNIVRGYLSTCPFFEKCQKRPEGGTRPWKLNHDCMAKWNDLRRSRKLSRTIPKFPNRRRMKELMKLQQQPVRNETKPAVSTTDTTDNSTLQGKHFIGQIIDYYARKYNVTSYRGSEQKYNLGTIQDFANLESEDQCRKAGEVELSLEEIFGPEYYNYEEFTPEEENHDEIVYNAETNEKCISDVMTLGTWPASETFKLKFSGIEIKQLDPIDYGDQVPEFEKLYFDILHNNVPLIQHGSFGFGNEDVAWTH